MVSVRAALLGIGLGLIAAPFTGLADPAPPSAPETAVYEKGFAAAQAATHTFRAELRQTLTLQGLDQPVVSTGELFYAAPDKLLIRFSDPAGEWMRISGGELEMKKTGQPPVRRDLTQGGSNAATLLDFFGGDAARWDRDFQVTMSREDDRLRVELVPWRVPGSKRQGVDRIVTVLRLPDYEVISIDVAMNAENRMSFEFSDGRRNAAVDPQLFRTP